MVTLGIIFFSFFAGSFATKGIDMVIDGDAQGSIVYLFMAVFQIPIILYLVSNV